MAKGRKKGPGRGRRGAAIDPATGRFLKTKTTSATTTTTTVTAATAPVAVAAGPTVTPEQVTEEISGFRKALMQTMQDIEGSRSEIQDAILDGLRKTAEELVQQNADIFGTKYEKTVDQSAAYEVFDAVVNLSEAATKARTVEQKRKILQRLRTYKKVAQNVFKGGGKQAEIARKLIDMISKIEEPLAKETGMRAAAKEKITDYIKQVPEKIAAKIPLVGGILSRSLQRRRERKEEEAEALASLTEEISRAGRTSLYGKRGGGEIGPTPSGMGDVTPPIPGGATVADIGGKGAGKFAFNKETVVTLKSILASVNDIKKLLLDRYDPAEEELKAEESAREEENSKIRMMGKLRGLFGKGGKAAPAAAAGEGGGILSSLLNLLGLGGFAETLGAVGATIGTIAAEVGAALAGIAATIGAMAAGVGSAIAAAAAATGTAVMAALPWAGAALGGLAIGGGAAWLINKGIDAAFGTDLADRMFEADTWTFGDLERDRKHNAAVKQAEAQRQQTLKSPEYVKTASQDWRNLPGLVRDKKMTGTEAIKTLNAFEEQYGAGPDTAAVRELIMQYDPSAENISPAIKGEIVNGEGKNVAQQTLQNLDQTREALSAETMGPPAPSAGNTVIAPTTNNSNTTINNNSGNEGVRNSDPTLKSAERASM